MLMSKNQHHAQASPYLQEVRERERAFLERAQRGENIRDEVILSLQPTVKRMAYRLYTRLSPQSHILKAVEIDDLEQEAYARMLVLFPKALEQKEPFRWLAGTAYGAMRDLLNGRGDTVKRHPSEKPIPILRLDQPLTDDGATLADVLPDTFHSPLLPEHVKEAIHQAVTALPEKQRTIILHHFGFLGTPASLRQIGRDAHPNSVRPHSTYQYKKALMTIRQALSDNPLSYQAKVAAGGTRS